MIQKLNFGKISLFLATGIVIWEVLSGLLGIESLISKNNPDSYIYTLISIEIIAGAAFVLGITGLFWKPGRLWALGGICLSIIEMLYIGFAIYLFWAINSYLIEPKVLYPGN